MAENVAKFIIQLEGGKQIEVATGNVVKMGNEVQKTGKKQKDAAAAANDLNYKLNQGTTGASSAARSFSKLNQAIGSGSNGLVGAYATLAANAFAVSAAFNRLREAAMAEQLLKGLEEQGARTGQTLTVIASNMRTLTGDAISMAESMQSAAQMTAAGFNTQTMERLTKVATDAAAALGRNVPDAMDRIVKGTTKLEPELLDELGLMTKLDEATRLYATQIGKAPAQLTRFEKQQAFVNAVAAEGERKFAGLADSAADLKAYDSLGAAFTDLTNSTLSFLNGALLPLANFLANNSVALAGVIVLFASTIRSQLLPALSEMAENSSKAAEKSKELAEAKREEISATAENAKVQAQEAATAARAFAIHQKAPKTFKDTAKAIKEGSTATEDFDKATKSLTRSIDTYKRNIKSSEEALKTYEQTQQKGVYADQAAIESKKELVSELEAQLTVLKQVQEADNAVANSATANADKIAKAKKAANRAELESVKATTVSETVGAASEGDFVGAFDKLSEGVANYKEKLDEVGEAGGIKKLASNFKESGTAILGSLKSVLVTTKAAGFSLNGLKVGFMAAAGGARVLGIAITNMLPIIGQVIMVAGLLWEAVMWLYDKTRPEGTEALNKALEDQAERYKNVADLANNLKRVGLDTAQGQTDSLTAVSNKVNEVASGYDEITKARANLGKSPLDLTAELDEPLKNLKLDSDLVDTEAFKALDALAKSGYGPLKDAIIATIQSNEQLQDSSVSLDTKNSILESTLNRVKNTFGSVGSNSKALADSFQSLDKSVEEFSRNAVAGTPFDAITKDMTSVAISVLNLQANLARGATDAKGFGIQLSAISTRAAGLLDIDIQAQVDKFKQAQAEIEKLQTKINSGLAISGDQAKLTSLQKEQEKSAVSLGTALSTNTLAIQQQLVDLQQILRTNQALASLESARFQMVSRGVEDSKELARAQDRSNERQAALETQSLNAQVKLQKSLQDNALREKKQLADKRKAIEDEISVQKQADAAQRKITKEVSENQIKNAEEVRRINVDNLKVDIVRANLSESNTEAFIRKMEELPEKTSKALQKLSSAFKDGPLGKMLSGKDIKRVIALDINADSPGLKELEARLAEIKAAQLANQGQVDIYASSIANLNAQAESIRLTKILSEAEKAARDAGYDLAILLEGLGVINSLTQAQNSLEQERLKLNKSVLGTFGQQVAARQLQMKIEIQGIKDQKQQDRVRLNNLKAQTKNQLNQKGLDADKRKVLQAQLDITNARLRSLTIEEQTLINIATEKATIQSIEEASFNIFTEGLEMQQKSLDVLRKRAELQGTILNQQQELRQLDADIGAARTGRPISERAQKSLDVQSAEEAAKLAEDQLDLKILGIRLEYELLEAQRIASVVDFKMKSQLLAAEATRLKGAGKTEEAAVITTMVNQLNSSIDYISQQSYKGLMDMAIQTEKRGVEILQKRADKLRAEFEGIGVIRTAANTYAQAINNAIISSQPNIATEKTEVVDPVVAAAAEAAKKQQEQSSVLVSSIETNFPLVSDSIQQLVKIFEPLVASLSKVLGVEASKSVQASKSMAATPQVSEGVKEVSKPSAAMQVATQPTSPTIETAAEDPEMLVSASKSSIKPTVDTEKAKMSFQSLWTFANESAGPLLETLKSLGPEGAAQAAVIEGFFSLGNTIQASMKQISKEGLTVENALSAASSALSGIQAIAAAASNAKIAAVDKEIAAEEKRDGKSAQSVAKIQALEKKKDAIAKKAFDTNKKLMIAEAVMSTAAGVAAALAKGPKGIPFAAIIGAMGAAQIAIIASTQYQSASTRTASATPPSTLSIGRRSDSVDLARGPSANAGGEAGFIRGSQGMGTNASNFRTIGSAYGGELMRGYGNRGFVVGEKGPEVITPETPINVTPANDVMGAAPVNATINIQALDASGVENILVSQKGNIIKMIRDAANASGQGFLEDVNVNVYTRPSVNKL